MKKKFTREENEILSSFDKGKWDTIHDYSAKDEEADQTKDKNIKNNIASKVINIYRNISKSTKSRK
ncbi:MAG: hypothetical protein OEV66_03175 [Spirochaetia bacterium]|nr:hypothetical protein [Spirochaetia bacterium]